MTRPMTRIMTRTLPRALAGTVAALALLAALPAGPARADSAEAAAFVEETGQEFLQLGATAPDDIDARAALLADFLMRRAALPLIARFTAGRNWRGMTDAQRSGYQSALHHLAARFFATRIPEIEGGGFEIVRTVEVPDRKGRPERTAYLVTTRVAPSGQEPLTIEWRVIRPEGNLRIVDFTVAGVSLLVTYRSEVASMFETHQGNVDAVIEAINARAGS